MGVSAAFIMPHPPLAVEGVSGKSEKDAIKKTMLSYHQMAREIARIRPDTIIVTSPHAIMYSDYFHVSPGRNARGDFSRFSAPQTIINVDYDIEFVNNLSRFCDDADFPAGTIGERDNSLDHGTMVPLYFVNQYYQDYQLVRIGLSGLPLSEHYLFGKFIKKVIDASDKRFVFIASGDLSHYQKEDGPYGFRPEGPLYDQKLIDALNSQDLSTLPDFPTDLLDRAGECGHRSFCIMAGAMEDEDVYVKVLSHENTFGVGYGCAVIEVLDQVGNRVDLTWEEIMMHEMHRFYSVGADKYTSYMEAAIMELQEQDPYVSLARKTINAHVLGEELPEGSDMPEEMKEKRAGTFVSIHKEGHLRGCIGTIIATKKNIVEEIKANAVSASTADPRFPQITPEELPLLDINVDVLTEPEMIYSEDMLDPKQYGVIVQNGNRLGLLLPDLEGVDTVRQQVDIAKRKAGIGPNEPVDLMRFCVIRHK